MSNHQQKIVSNDNLQSGEQAVQNIAEQVGKSKGYKRSTLLIRPQYQARVGLFTGIMAVLALLICVGSLVLLPLLVATFSRQRTYIPSKTLDMLMLSFPWLVLVVGIIFAFAVFAGIYYSHRIAGPLHKIESLLQQRLAGNSAEMIRLRPKDQLHGLAQLLNDLMESDSQMQGSGAEMIRAIEAVFFDIEGKMTILEDQQNITLSEQQYALLRYHYSQLKQAITRQTG